MQHAEGAPHGLVGRDRVGFDPFGVDEAVEVLASLRAVAQFADVEDALAEIGRRGGAGRCRCRCGAACGRRRGGRFLLAAGGQRQADGECQRHGLQILLGHGCPFVGSGWCACPAASLEPPMTRTLPVHARPNVMGRTVSKVRGIGRDEKGPAFTCRALFVSDRDAPRSCCGTNYQIFTCLSSPRTIASPGLHWNAVANAGMFDGAPIARSDAGACGSVFSRSKACFSRMLPRQTRAQLRKNRWSSL